MRVLEYLLGVLFFCGVYLLGRWMTRQSQRWDHTAAQTLARHTSVRKFFLYGGRIFQVVGVIWGFLDAVSVLVLGLGLAF